MQESGDTSDPKKSSDKSPFMEPAIAASVAMGGMYFT